jgi:tRNA threonylcarbamoyladenosine biosynthesis protein TsaB
MLLAIDTSNEWSGVAFWDANGLRAEATWFSGRQHTEQVGAQIDLLAQHIGLARHDLSVVAVATGPGSWSGLRSGMSLAKAIAIGRKLPLIGISTLDALAQSEFGRGGLVLTLIRLGRDRYAAARYQDTPHGRVRQDEIEAYSVTEMSELAAGMVLVGDIPPALNGTATSTPLVNRQRRAAYLAELAWTRHMQHDYDDLVALEPIYLGNPVR